MNITYKTLVQSGKQISPHSENVSVKSKVSPGMYTCHYDSMSKEALKLFEETDFSAFDESNAISVKIHHEWIGNAGINSKETPHIYRHCYASNELQKGANLASISKDLGHNSITPTLIYARLISPGYTTVMVEKNGVQKSVGYFNTAYNRNLDLMLSHVDSDLIDTWFKEGTVNETPEGIDNKGEYSVCECGHKIYKKGKE